ncbi:ATP synthase subunit I [Steroidobacter denitrificans]|nr:ATP synthase subunit I [Steroidobacter denitrificans]
MSVSLAATPTGQAIRILRWQVLGVGLSAAIAAILWDAGIGRAVLAGGGIGAMPTVYVALALLRSSLSAGAAPVSVLRVFAGWVIKNVLTIALLVIAFRSRAFAPPALLGGVGVALAAYWLCMVLGRVKHANSVDSG